MEATYIMFIILYMFLQRVGEIFTNSSLFAAWGGGICQRSRRNAGGQVAFNSVFNWSRVAPILWTKLKE